MNKVITIGREFGSGGRELGRRLAEKLGYAYYDQEIVQEIAKRTELSEGYVHQILEKKPIVSYPIHIGGSFHMTSGYQGDHGLSVFREQCNILREMAEQSNCVIVGRCADYILRDMNPFRIFVYADMESKLARCRAKGEVDEQLTDKAMIQQIKNVDKQRARYYEFCTDQKWGDRQHYDLCVNTSNVEIKRVVSILSKMFE